MLGLEVVVLLGGVLVAAHLAAWRFRIAPPVLLLVSGVLLGFVPALREVFLPPKIVLLIFLPVLLYWESLTSSLREIRNNLRPIVLMSTTLVVLTASAVAAAAHALGIGWGPAWVLGAAVAPTDATAVGVLARRLPRRNVTILRAESLINDGTALVVYGLAVGITVGEESLTPPHVGWLFLLSYGGGVLIGAVVAWCGVQLRRHLGDPLLENTAIITVPFAAYLVAETVDASGVLAVVACGLIMSQAAPRVGGAAGRRQAEAFWSLATFLITGALFVLVGLEAQTAARQLTSTDLATAAIAVGVVTAVVIGVRFAYLFTAPYLVRLVDRRSQQRERRIPATARIISATAGFRGAISLALALSVPATLDSGQPFPDRDAIVFVTCGVILITLIVQGLAMPAVVRWARLPHDEAVIEELHLAQTRASEEVLEALPRLAAELDTGPAVTDRVRGEIAQHLAFLRAHAGETNDDPALRHAEQYTALRLAAIEHERSTVLGLRDEQRIDDAVLRQLQAVLDVEEMRLQRFDRGGHEPR
ncbi:MULTISPECIES: Na+/H+ antiporter [Streptomyces]|uniref:Na+/H+ antiporter n=1 Tax=Streptomyces silvae TaxID=2803812 RepID=A0ABU7ZUR8_9ACTN|nr:MULTISPECIES: Na+/H+ antiporter [unclassified Streptomyces]MDX3327366.1 Na+/H+ antiporter [Streptomyces sp. ME02-6979-3A]MDX3433574.1 Na+/H+ antiporter [Streptomyces sp. ME01-18a]MDX3688563.1 Na+/H+ antiporter [Streptomyces sp. AK04-4c]